MLSKVSEEYQTKQFLINKIVYDSLNLELFNERYDAYELEYIGEKKWIDFNASFFDKLDKKSTIESVSYVGGRKVYILLKKGESMDVNDFLTIAEQQEYRMKTFLVEALDKEYNPNKIYVIYNLLLNALGKYPEDEGGFSNVKGQLYFYVATKDAAEGQHILMNIKIKNGLLIRTQHSFCRFNEEVIWHQKRAKLSLIQGPGKTVLIRKYDGKGPAYVIGGDIKNKVIIPVDNYALDDTKNTKIKIYNELEKYFNHRYKGLVKLEYQCLEVKNKPIEKFGKVKKKKIADIQTLSQVYYVRLEQPQTEREIRNEQQFVKELKLLYPTLRIVKRLKKAALNIVLIHSSDYYKKQGIADRKLTINKAIITQCITIESIAEKRIDALQAPAMHVFNELFVKNELYQQKIERWNYDAIEFYLGLKTRADKQGCDEYHCMMRINQDGSFMITSDIEKIDKNHYRKYLNELKNQGGVCIVKKGDNYNRIYHTDYMPMVDGERLDILNQQSQDKGNKTRIKTKEALQDGLVFPYYGKTIMNINDQLHYCIGESDGALKFEVVKMCNIYKIESVDDSEIIYEILDMLEDIHVRGSSGESVRPYPFKYMMEYIRINHISKNFVLK